MSHNHPALFYETREKLCDEIFQFFEEGIDRSERCVFLSTQSDVHEMYERLIASKDRSKVTKLYSYYFMPDPTISPEAFEAKFTNLKKTILTEEFQGRVAFNVLGDISRFSVDHISNIENAEKYLHQISNDKLKLFCSFKVGTEGENVSKMIKMAMSNHDHVIFEKE
jgi:undecaprenyl pyrophosphate synthase